MSAWHDKNDCDGTPPFKSQAEMSPSLCSDTRHIDDDDFAWAAVDTKRHLRRGMFVAQVVGKSMEPAIPDRGYCLFAAPVGGTRQGKTVLVQMRDAADPESGERYTVKRYESEKTSDEDSWQHTNTVLLAKQLNR